MLPCQNAPVPHPANRRIGKECAMGRKLELIAILVTDADRAKVIEW